MTAGLAPASGPIWVLAEPHPRLKLGSVVSIPGDMIDHGLPVFMALCYEVLLRPRNEANTPANGDIAFPRTARARNSGLEVV